MPDAASDAFLQGQGVPVALTDIEAELTRLWGPAAVLVGGPDLEHPSVTRVVLANLVVVAPRVPDAEIGDVLDALAARYPCRTIVLRPTADPARAVKAEVAALCHLPAPGQPQVCSERITLNAGPAARDLLPGAVRPILEPDLPCVLWWADAADAADPLFRTLAAEATRLLLDPPRRLSDPAGLKAALDLGHHPYARDITWFGLPRLRGLIAGLFDGPDGADARKRINSVEVRCVAPFADRPPRMVAWLAAWLAGQLGWEPLRRDSPRPGEVVAAFRSPAGEVAVRLTTAADPALTLPGILGVTLTTRGPGGEGRYQLDRPTPDAAEVHIEARVPGRADVSRTVVAPPLDAARRVAAALDSSRDDPPYCAALPHAMWLLGA